MHLKYNHDLSKLPKPTDEDADYITGMSYKRYLRLEEEAYKKGIIDPITDLIYYCSVSYTSPKGRNHYEDYKIFKADDVGGFIDNIEKHENYKNTKEYQRGLMTEKLRFKVLMRDGKKCKLCGRGAEDGVKLHVDYIRPIAKGGKTELNNLQTLCEQCNRGKSDSWDE